MHKTLITVVTRNNSVLLQNLINSIEQNDAGSDYDLVIADNTSTDSKHLNLLDSLSKKYKIEICENDRAETSYSSVSRKYLNDYDYFYFLHDDTFVHKNNWLVSFIDRINSKYYEPEIQNTHLAKYDIGRVSSLSQPWRDFEKCKGFPLPSLFLKECLAELWPSSAENIWIYKYSDQERVLYTKKCLEKSPMWYLKWWKDNQDLKFNNIKNILNKHLSYPDEGMGPKTKYPAGETWCKFMLLTEFLNAVYPLMCEFRTVGLEGNGYLEQIDGFDNAWGHDSVSHYGSCNMKKYLAKRLNTTSENIHKKLYSNDLTFITICNKIIKETFK